MKYFSIALAMLIAAIVSDTRVVAQASSVDVMERLSPEHREVIDLVYYHETSVEEAARIVGIPENTVKTRLFHARKKLGEMLKAAGIDRGWP